MPSRKVILDKFEINILRLTCNDTEIARSKKTSFWNLIEQCWTREENWIPKATYPIRKPKTVIYIAPKVEKTELRTEKWEQQKQENYWENEKKFWKVVNIWSNPLPWVVLQKNTVWYTF